MDEVENPGASADAHGASDSVLADASDNTANGETGQDREPRSRFELIVYNSGAALYGTPPGNGIKPEKPEAFYRIDAYDFVPDRARTDMTVGSVEMRERVFLCLVYIAESIIGGWPHNYEMTIKLRVKQLLEWYGDKLNLALLKKFIQEIINGGVKNGGL
jgi:hypothetical protein